MSRHDEAPCILEINPAVGYWLVWRDASGELLEPMPAWATVEQDGSRWVEPMAYAGFGLGLELACRDPGYCGLRWFAPGAEPMQQWASDEPA